MNKELELEAEKYYKENVEGEPLTYETQLKDTKQAKDEKQIR